MKQVTIKVGGRELALVFILRAIANLEAELGENVVLTNEQLDELLCRPGKLTKLLAVMANEGELAAGRKPDITADWLGGKLRPGNLPTLQAQALDAITQGMRMETEEDDEDEPVDVVLEEIKKKDEKAG